jgi:1-acyl-sn-glycerol-3-phosphate acyltransferase
MQAGKFARNVVVDKPGEITERAASFARRFVSPVVRACFRPSISGLENLPADRPYLLVTNHSAGVGLAEILGFASLWLNEFGSTRKMAGFALPLGFVVWPFSAVHREIGSIPSSYDAARDALAKGSPLLVFPGGDHESLKPIWQVHRVDFYQRVGFLRIAHEAGVPIVPMGITNGGYTAPILYRSRVLPWVLVVPRLMGIKRWGVSLLAVVVAAAIWLWLPVSWPVRAAIIWLWLGSPLTFLPIFPATLRYRVGEPLEPCELFGDNNAPRELREALRIVQDAVQALVNPRQP